MFSKYIKSKIFIFMIMSLCMKNIYSQCYSPYIIGDGPQHIFVDIEVYNNKFVVLDGLNYVLSGDGVHDWSSYNLGSSINKSISWNGEFFLISSGEKLLKGHEDFRWVEVDFQTDSTQKTSWLSKKYFVGNDIVILEDFSAPLVYEMKEWGLDENDRTFRTRFGSDGLDKDIVFYGNDVDSLRKSNVVPRSRDILKINDQYYLLTKNKGIYASKDIANWEYYSGEKQPKGFPRTMIYNGSILVTVGDYGYITTSNDDGKTWQVQKLNTESDFYDVIWDGKQFIAVGNCGTVAKSKDGYKWSFTSTNQPDFYTAIAYNGETYVIVGAGPGEERNKKTNSLLMQRMFISKDAETWTDNTDKILDLYRQ